MEKDYRRIPELDLYEQDGIDEAQYSDMEHEQKREADLRMRERDLRAQAGKGRMPEAIMGLGGYSEDEYDD